MQAGPGLETLNFGTHLSLPAFKPLPKVHDYTLLPARKGRAPYLVGCVAEIVIGCRPPFQTSGQRIFLVVGTQTPLRRDSSLESRIVQGLRKRGKSISQLENQAQFVPQFPVSELETYQGHQNVLAGISRALPGRGADCLCLVDRRDRPVGEIVRVNGVLLNVT